MMDATEIRKKAARKYLTYLKAEAIGENLFPMRIPGKLGSSKESYHVLQTWLEKLLEHSKQRKGWGYTVHIPSTTNTQKHGQQSLPKAILIETPADFLRLIGKQEEFRLWKQDMELIQRQRPRLWNWAAENPKQVLAYQSEWRELLLVIAFFEQTPQPGLYMRDLPLELDTKFVERRKKILRTLLEMVLPDGAYKPATQDFEEQFGLKKAPFMVRFRVLDPGLQDIAQLPANDLALPVGAFAKLPFSGVRVVVSENLATYLSMPNMKHTVVIWGEGASVAGVQAEWLNGCEIFYWGDLDIQGFQFLARFRRHYPQTCSIFMDENTLNQHAAFFVEGTSDNQNVPEELTQAETAVYNRLKAENIRLEQERITYHWRESQLRNLF